MWQRTGDEVAEPLGNQHNDTPDDTAIGSTVVEARAISGAPVPVTWGDGDYACGDDLVTGHRDITTI